VIAAASSPSATVGSSSLTQRAGDLHALMGKR
jgi:hypothetical protein